MHLPIQLIALDLDGTLLNSQHQLTPRTARAIQQAIAEGVQVVIATGKTYASVRPVVEQLGLTSPAVCVQGLVLHNPDGSVRSTQALDPALVRHVAEFAEAGNHVVVAYSGLRILIREWHSFAEVLVAHDEPVPEVVGSLVPLAGQIPINKFIFYNDPDSVSTLREELAAHVDGQATLVQPLPELLEVLPLGTGKGAGLARLLAELGIDPQHVLAAGDGENDADMLRLAGIGVAMGNAMQAAKDAADVVVASNDEDGVAEAIERYVLKTVP